MLGMNLIAGLLLGQDTDELTVPLEFELATGDIEEGALVELADGRLGLIQMISASPFHGETCQRAYCYAAMWELGERWASWELLDDLTVIG